MTRIIVREQLSSTSPAPGADALRRMTDADIVAAVVGGAEPAFRELVERHQRRLHRFVSRMVGDAMTAEDLVQEAFVRAYTHLATFDGTRNFGAWLFTIAANLAKNELRDRRRRPMAAAVRSASAGRRDESAGEIRDTAALPDELCHRRLLRARILDTASRLPARHRDVFVLREFEGRSYGEIATLTRCKVGTVRSRLSRAREAFAASIRPWVE